MFAIEKYKSTLEKYSGYHDKRENVVVLKIIRNLQEDYSTLNFTVNHCVDHVCFSTLVLLNKKLIRSIQREFGLKLDEQDDASSVTRFKYVYNKGRYVVFILVLMDMLMFLLVLFAWVPSFGLMIYNFVSNSY